MNLDIRKATIFITLHGSHAYGMAREGSDVDIKGIAIPPSEYFLGFSDKFEQFESQYPFDIQEHRHLEKIVGRSIPSDEKMDCTIYDIRKFFHLAAQCNPNIIEVLFTNPDIFVVSHPVMEMLIDNRELFLSTRANFRFRGYAFAQLKRIKRHRRWLLNPPDKKPEREDFGLPMRTVVPADQLQAAESLIKKRVEEWIFDQDEMHPELLASVRQKTISTFSELFSGLKMADITDADGNPDDSTLSDAAGRLLGYSDNFLELLDRERRYKTSHREYKQYKVWEASRNPARAALESKFGFDCKHASHLVRLMRMAEEILSDGKVEVCRKDAEDLLDIRRGSWDYDSLVEWAEVQDQKIQDIYDSGKSPLLKYPDINRLNKLCIEMVEKFNGA